MTECDRAAVRVDESLIETDVANDRERLGGESLVELDPLQIVASDAGVLERDGDCLLGTDAHDRRGHAPRPRR